MQDIVFFCCSCPKGCSQGKAGRSFPGYFSKRYTGWHRSSSLPTMPTLPFSKTNTIQLLLCDLVLTLDYAYTIIRMLWMKMKVRMERF